MRKNGVNKELRSISKGLLAPNGFRLKTTTVKDGSEEVGTEKPLTLLLFDARYPTACVFSTSSVKGESALFFERNLSDGKANAVLFNGAFPDVLDKTAGERTVCFARTIARSYKIEEKDVLILSTGGVRRLHSGEKIILNAVSPLLSNVQNENYAVLGEAIGLNQIAFEFDLGDFPCKVGACFKRLGASSFAYLTTDINVTPACLESAFCVAVKDTFDLIGEGQSAPRFFAGISSSCKAGNFLVSERDGEFKKLVDGLRSACERICRLLVLGEAQIGAECILTGARSKTVSRALARSLARFLSSPYDETEFLNGVLDGIGSTEVEFSLKKASLTISGNGAKLLLLEDGEVIAPPLDLQKRILRASFFTLELNLSDGNYSSRAFAYAHTINREETRA